MGTMGLCLVIISALTTPGVPADAGTLVPHLIPRPPLPASPFLVAGLGRASRAAVQALCDAVGPDLVCAWEADTGKARLRVQRELRAQGTRTWQVDRRRTDHRDRVGGSG
jgi:hypothetical protein